jgi:hypothetical protein
MTAFQQDGRLSRQVDTLIGTIQGGMRVEAFSLASHALPHPDELDCADEAFERNYAQVETFLAAEELEFKALWPVPGLTVSDMPVQMEPGVELDAMTDQELAVGLRTDIVRPHFAHLKLFEASAADRTCFRYRYRLPKLVGGGNDQERTAQRLELEKRLGEIRSTIEEALVLILPEPVMATGRFVISDAQWNPTAEGGVQYQQATVPRSLRMRNVEMDAQSTSELQELWCHLSRRDILQRHRGLSLAMRRLSYQAQRERPEDELLDTMIAAEALYLTDIGNETYRGELRYRLALRAAVWADAAELGLTKREVLKLMQSSYDARSAIAHGGTPNPRTMKIQNNRVEFPELVKKTKEVIGSGCRKALAAAASGLGWPPEWDTLILADEPGTEPPGVS